MSNVRLLEQAQVHPWYGRGLSDTGLCRQVNEDAVLTRQEAGLWVVADGVGGGSAGDRASRALVEISAQVHVYEGLQDQLFELEEAWLALNSQLRLYAEEELKGRTLATTAVALILRMPWAAVLWAGDSRLYRWRQGVLQQLTRDHSMYQQALDRGQSPLQIPAELRSRILRAVGAEDRLTLDVQLIDCQEGDRFLLCTDGVHALLADTELEQIMALMPELALAHIKSRCLALGAPDNFSFIFVSQEAAAL